MGIQVWGLLGGFQKKVGPAVGHWTNGQNVVTALPHPSDNPPTVPQLNAQAKFGLTISFLRRLTAIIRVGFQNSRKEKQSAFNAAFVYNYKNAITGVAPAYTIDYPKVMYSKGILSRPYAPSMATTEDAQLDFSWLGLFEYGAGASTDLATFVVYNPAKELFVSAVGVAARSVLSYDMALPADFSSDNVYVYMSFVSADGKQASDSVYLGATVVQ